MEDILALLLIFGGGTLVAISFSPVGRAFAERIRGGRTTGETDPAVLDELDRVRTELAELHEGVLFIIIVFGGGMVLVLSKSEIGRAVIERIRGSGGSGAADPALLDEVERLRHDVTELQERVDFAERLLAKSRESGQLREG